MRSFTPEGMANMLSALAGLGHVPDKLWLRAFAGMVSFNIRWVAAGQLPGATGCRQL
jgi:hypothetical protein